MAFRVRPFVQFVACLFADITFSIVAFVSIAVAVLAFAVSNARAAEGDAVGLDAAKKPLSELVPLTLIKDRLAIDKSVWESLHKKVIAEGADVARARLAKRMGIPPERVTDNLLTADQGMERSVIGRLFMEVLDAGGGGRSGGSRTTSSSNRIDWRMDRQALAAKLFCDPTAQEFDLSFVEKSGGMRSLRVEEDKASGLTLRWTNPEAKASFLFVQSKEGSASLIINNGAESLALNAETFTALLQKAPEKVQVGFIRPLSDIGILFPPSPHLPTVIAAATSGFGAAAPDAAKQADELFAQLAHDDQDIREKATVALRTLYPLAIHKIRVLAETSPDAEVKTRLRTVIQAHPGIERALPYVEEKKLHTDKAYLMGLFASTPFFKAAARARLAELHGKDFGDDPAAWPKP